jgi:hypothetical protein
MMGVKITTGACVAVISSAKTTVTEFCRGRACHPGFGFSVKDTCGVKNPHH